MNQFREHARNHMAQFVSRELGDNVFRLPSPPTRSGENQRSEALDLVYQAAEVIKANEDRAAETEAKSLDMVRHAVEQLEKAVRLTCIADEAKRASEARAHAAENAVMRLDAKVQKLEKALRETQSFITTLRAQLSDNELRAEAAERRATEATSTLACVENAIRTKLLGKGRSSSKGATAAA